jgi:hypothetical protein
LLPKETTTERWIQQLELEKGLIISILLILLGFFSSVGALIYWGENRFGPIEPSRSMRLVIPGAILFALGIQIFFSSFFLGILNTKIKSNLQE